MTLLSLSKCYVDYIEQLGLLIIIHDIFHFLLCASYKCASCFCNYNLYTFFTSKSTGIPLYANLIKVIIFIIYLFIS